MRSRRQELDVRTDLNVVADHDLGDIEGHQAEVHERPGPDVDLIAVIAVHGRPDLRSFAEISEQVVQKTPAQVGIGCGAAVEPLHQGHGPQVVSCQFGVVGDVEVTGEHAFALGSSIRRWSQVSHVAKCTQTLPEAGDLPTDGLSFGVDPTRLELVTSAMRRRRSPN